MPYSEAVELLLAAKPLSDRIRFHPLGYKPNRIEREVLETIEQILKDLAYNEDVLNKAGWTKVDLALLDERLAFY